MDSNLNAGPGCCIGDPMWIAAMETGGGGAKTPCCRSCWWWWWAACWDSEKAEAKAAVLAA